MTQALPLVVLIGLLAPATSTPSFSLVTPPDGSTVSGLVEVVYRCADKLACATAVLDIVPLYECEGCTTHRRWFSVTRTMQWDTASYRNGGYALCAWVYGLDQTKRHGPSCVGVRVAHD